MKHLFSQKGFSLVQGIILAGVVAGSSLVATRILTDQKRAQKGAETRDMVDELHNVIYTTLQNRNHCKETMMDHGIQGALGTGTGPHTLTYVSAENAADKVVEVGKTYLNNNVKVGSISLGPQTGGWRTLEIVYERLNSKDPNFSARTQEGYGAKRLKKSIALRIQKEPMNPNTFSACYAVTADASEMNGEDSAEKGNDIAKQICDEMNIVDPSDPPDTVRAFVWDEALSICKPAGQCPGDQVFTGVDTNGRVKCRNLSEWIDLGAVIDSTPPTGCASGKQVRLEIDNATKRVKLVCF